MTLKCLQSDGKGNIQQIGIWLKLHGGSAYIRVRSMSLVWSNQEKPEGALNLLVFSSTNVSLRPSLSQWVEAILRRHAFIFRKGSEREATVNNPDVLGDHNAEKEGLAQV
jgi:hypothetical protein